MPDYPAIRSLHVACAALSITLFIIRASLQMAHVDWRSRRWLRVVPHANDTVLLCAAITLAIMSGQYPLQQAWLTAKVVALFAYVGFGALALSQKTGDSQRKFYFVMALWMVTYIVYVAITKSATLHLV